MAKAKYFIGSVHNTPNGAVKILEIIPKDLDKGVTNKRAVIRFIETGYTCNVQLSNLPSGKVKDRRRPSVYGVGYIDCDITIPQRGSGSIIRSIYDLWSNMIKRAYTEYTDVSVDKRWHSFKQFLSTIHLVEGYSEWELDTKMCLDKDIKVKGNKVYGLDTCKFVSEFENVQEAALRRWHKK